MKINIGDYLIESESLQFTVKERKMVQDGENKGRFYEVNIAYCCKIDEALRFIPQEVLRTNDDINIIIDKLNKIHADIQALEYKPVIITKQEKENNQNE